MTLFTIQESPKATFILNDLCRYKYSGKFPTLGSLQGERQARYGTLLLTWGQKRQESIYQIYYYIPFVDQTRQAPNSLFHAAAMASSGFCSQMRMVRHMAGGCILKSWFLLQGSKFFVYILKEQRPSLFMLVITWAQPARKLVFLI